MRRAPINTDNIDINKLPEMKALSVHRHKELHRCPKCGMRRSRLPMWLLRVLGMENTNFRTIYCKGSEEAEKEVHLLPGLATKVNPICAGVTEEHLHQQCMNCNYVFLMGTRDASRNS